MVRKEEMAIFESNYISETEEFTPIKIGVHAWYINPYMPESIELIPID